MIYSAKVTDIFNLITACLFRNFLALALLNLWASFLQECTESKQIYSEPVFHLESLIAFSNHLLQDGLLSKILPAKIPKTSAFKLI